MSYAKQGEQSSEALIFGRAFENELIERPVRFGSQFEKPSAKRLQREENERQARLFTADEIRRMIEAAGSHLRVMILLGINGGLGNTDVARLPIDAADVQSGWLDFPQANDSQAISDDRLQDLVNVVRE